MKEFNFPKGTQIRGNKMKIYIQRFHTLYFSLIAVFTKISKITVYLFVYNLMYWGDLG